MTDSAEVRDAIAVDENTRKRQDECLLTIRRTMMALLAFVLFILLTIGTPDRVIIGQKQVVTLPFAQVPITFTSFLIVAPVILVAIWCYMQIYIMECHRPEMSKIEPRVPVLAVLSPGVPWVLFLLISEALVPAVLLAVAFKSLFLSYAGIWFAGVVALSVVASTLHWRRMALARRPYRSLVISAWTVVAMITGFFAVDPDYATLLMPIDLRQTDLSKVDLREIRLTNAKMSGATLPEIDLRGMNLTGVILTGANLEKAKLTNANLSGAILNGVDLQTVDLSGATLIGADFSEASLASKDLSGMDLTGVILTGADLEEAQLTNANLSGRFSMAWICRR